MEFRVIILNVCYFAEIEGYIKNPISEVTMYGSSRINQGCISDCKNYKLEIRMPFLCCMKEFVVGSHVKANGIVKYAGYPYLWVVWKEDITLASGTIAR